MLFETKKSEGKSSEVNESERRDRALSNAKWLILSRLAAVVVCLGIIMVTALGRGRLNDELYPTYLILVVVCLFNLGYLVSLKRVRRARRFACMQIVLDLLFATGLVYVNGAGNSNLSWLYFACILSASTMVGASAGLVVASLATIFLANVTMLTFIGQQNGWALPWTGTLLEGYQSFGNFYLSIAYLLAQGLAFHLVAILSGRLVWRLKGSDILGDELLQNINEGVIAVDADNRVVHMNREAGFLLGLSDSPDLTGLRLAEVVGRSETLKVLAKHLDRHESVREQIELPGASGGRIPVSLTGSILSDEAGRYRGMVWLLTDLTEQHQMEEAMEQARRMELVGQMSASIAHEIRNPLASIRGSAQELGKVKHLDEQSGRLMEVVVRESDRINAVITEFLHFAGTRTPTLRRCNLTDILTDTVLLLEGRYPERGHRIELETSEPVFALGDAEQLRQVFLNLGLNALEAMQMPGVLRLRAEYREVRPRWAHPEVAEPVYRRACVTFEDEGDGFEPEDVEQLFVPFYTTKTRGTGLGLAVARRIVEGHHGTIQVHSRAGIGSCFTVDLEAYGTGAPVPVCVAAE